MATVSLPVPPPTTTAELHSPTKVEAARRYLDKILATNIFNRSKDLCRFLKFVAESALEREGPDTELKEYVIGVEVFNRGQDFNPSLDPIVRVQARRLRAKLDQYYLTEGAQDELRIDIPSGGYVPYFRAWRSGPSGSATSASTSAPARIVPATEQCHSVGVLPFLNIGPEENEPFSDGLTEELVHEFSEMADCNVVARTTSFQFKGKGQDVRAIGRQLGACALIEGSVRWEGSRLRVSARLIRVSDGKYVWSAVYDQIADHVFAIQEEIARSIAHAACTNLALSNPE